MRLLCLKQKYKRQSGPLNFKNWGKIEFVFYLFQVFELTHSGGFVEVFLMPWSPLDTCQIYVTTIQIQKKARTQYRCFGRHWTPVRNMLQASLPPPHNPHKNLVTGTLTVMLFLLLERTMVRRLMIYQIHRRVPFPLTFDICVSNWNGLSVIRLNL